jgi:hypothetical protein
MQTGLQYWNLPASFTEYANRPAILEFACQFHRICKPACNIGICLPVSPNMRNGLQYWNLPASFTEYAKRPAILEFACQFHRIWEKA